MTRLSLVLCAFSLNASSQWLSFGVTGGVPISPHSATYPPATIDLRPSSEQPADVISFEAPNDFYQKPYAVGPTLDVNLPWNISLEAGMLYERLHREVSAGLTPVKGTGSANFGYVSSVAGNAFLFPLLAKYNVGHRRIKPFVEAGATLRHLSALTGQGIQLDFFLHPTATTFQFAPGKELDVAVTTGAGFRYRVAMLDVVPEIRYLHWTAQFQQPVQNQAMLMITVAFPSRR